MKKMGSLKGMLDLIPGAAGQISEDQIDEGELKREEAILTSMTRKERSNYLIIGPTRRSRIARGSGTSVAEVARLLKKFEKTRVLMKKMARGRGKEAQAISRRMGG